ncbi:YraN family protein [Alteromonas halophila]|uniref:UPF0102 protein GCM10007391_33780 n=1 Tax=Alteromonas halophila TaxID=516698 RepID=A0A918N193_9ALTE|nr:YraN family protein [Alteromonas halophila]GGW96928.1 UPF0102 protein [Alteromonas halophila]
MSVRQGNAGEDEALRYLEGQGLKLITRNYRTRSGELDLVMQDGDTLVCIEVKCRANADYGNALDYVTAAKQRRLRSAFTHYLVTQGHNPSAVSSRFDVISIQSGILNWLKNVMI